MLCLDFQLVTGVKVANLTTASLAHSKKSGKNYATPDFADEVTTFLWAVKRLGVLLGKSLTPVEPLRCPGKIGGCDVIALGFPRPSAALSMRPKLSYEKDVITLLCKRADTNPSWKGWYPQLPELPIQYVDPNASTVETSPVTAVLEGVQPPPTSSSASSSTAASPAVVESCTSQSHSSSSASSSAAPHSPASSAGTMMKSKPHKSGSKAQPSSTAASKAAPSSSASTASW